MWVLFGQALAIFLGAAAAIVTISGTSPATEAVAVSLRPGIGVIAAQRSNGVIVSTAFVAGKNLVVAPQQVVAGASEIVVRFPDQPGMRAQVIAADAARNLAVLAIPGLPVAPLRLADVAAVQVDDKVIVITSKVDKDGSHSLTVAEGTVTSTTGRFLTIDSPIGRIAGGLVANPRGEILGLVSGRTAGSDYQPITVAPASAMKSMLAAIPAQPSAGTPPAPQASPPPAAPQPSVPPPAPQASVPSTPPSAATADRFSVAPGQGIGPVKLGMTINDVISALGPQQNTTKLPDGSVVYSWFAAPQYEGLGIRATDAGNVESVWALNDTQFVIKDRLRVGSSEAEVRAALGEPSIVNLDLKAHTKTLLYGGIGVWFTIQLDPQYKFYNVVNEIGVMSAKAP